ncbi:MAG: OmpP1/FadL family transporter [Flammeovirgaceae bacterium]
MKQLRVIFSLLLISITAPSFGQLGTTPYSIFGLGEVMPQGNIRNMGMGGVGLSNGSGFYTNILNPALLIHNPYVIFEAGFLAEYKNLEVNGQSQNDAGGNLLNLHLAFPVVRGKYTMGIGLRPATVVNYEFKTEEKLPQTPTFFETRYQGEGGVSQVYWAHGYKIKKGISVGLEAIYNFGSVTNHSETFLLDGTLVPLDAVDITSRTFFSDFTITPGVVFSAQLDSASFLNFGLTYERQVNLDVDFSREFQRQTRGETPISIDTISTSTERIRLPQSLNVGVSFEKSQKYTVGLDVSLEQWAKFTNTIETSNLSNSWKVALGGEWTPDISSISSYFKRVTYRLGVRYSQTPWTVNDVQIPDIGINFGFSLPISRGLSSMNVAFTYGQRGEIQDDIIRERYFRVALGANINDPQWFRRRRFN